MNMKTPREKAEELVNKFLNFVREKDFFGDNEEFKNAKQCALIAVDEILNSNPKEFGNIINALKYWQEVKSEINNL